MSALRSLLRAERTCGRDRRNDANVIYGYQPQVGASADALVAFYDGNRTRILIAAVFCGMVVLNLLWFAAAIRTTLADAGHDSWGAAVTTSSAVLGGLLLLLLTVAQPSPTQSPAPEITCSHRD